MKQKHLACSHQRDRLSRAQQGSDPQVALKATSLYLLISLAGASYRLKKNLESCRAPG